MIIVHCVPCQPVATWSRTCQYDSTTAGDSTTYIRGSLAAYCRALICSGDSANHGEQRNENGGKHVLEEEVRTLLGVVTYLPNVESHLKENWAIRIWAR